MKGMALHFSKGLPLAEPGLALFVFPEAQDATFDGFEFPTQLAQLPADDATRRRGVLRAWIGRPDCVYPALDGLSFPVQLPQAPGRTGENPDCFVEGEVIIIVCHTYKTFGIDLSDTYQNA